MTPFGELAEVFQKLEQTSSNTALITILANFLSRLNPDEARAVAYLLRGEVAAPFESLEIGMAERMALRTVADAYGISEQRVEKLLAKAGDLGTVVQGLAGGKRGHPITIIRVFGQLQKIARISGQGSQQQKSARLVQLLSGAPGIEAKYMLRTVLGTHRVGVADMTFLRALAKAYTGKTENWRSAEAAYNVLSDLGEVSRRMARSGLGGLKRVAPVAGTPVRMMLASRVQNLDDVARHLRGEMFVEFKYDGERVQIHLDGKRRPHAFSRRLERITHQYPEILEALVKSSVPNNTIIEGEIVAFDAETNHLLPFQTLMQRRRKHEIHAYIKKVPIAFFVFDLLFLKNRNLLGEPLSVRRRLLEKSIKPSRLIGLSKYTLSTSVAGIERYFREALASGAEASSSKRRAALTKLAGAAGSGSSSRESIKNSWPTPLISSWSGPSTAKATALAVMARCFLLRSILPLTNIIR
jgi:DNA ligase 1